MRRRLGAIAVAACAAWCVCASVAGAAVQWPDTELARHARAWFEMLASDETKARTFFAEHMAANPQNPVTIETRLQRRAGVLERTGGLTPLEVVDDDGTRLSVRCKAGNGDEVTAAFEGEAAAPHRLLGVRLEAGPPGSGGAPPRPAGPALDDAEAARQAKAWLDSRSASGAWSGAALIARGNDVLVSGAWGEADRAKRIPNTADTRFNVGSIGKLFTRVAIAQLAQVGKLSLDDALSRFLPDFPHADSITIGMLCAHRSGVGDFFNDAYEATDKARLRHNRDYLPLIRNQPLWFPPGTSQRYSNGGYVLLGEVIAKASGEDYYDYLAKHVFGPAGMTSTAALVEGDGTKGVARGYTAKGGGEGERDNAGTRPARGSAAGGSYSTLADLLAFDRALLGARLCGRDWASWVAGGPRPDGPSAPSPPEMPSFGFAGGAPGLNAEWSHEGDVVTIVFTNRDPEVAQPTVQGLQDIVRRMKPGGAIARP